MESIFGQCREQPDSSVTLPRAVLHIQHINKQLSNHTGFHVPDLAVVSKRNFEAAQTLTRSGHADLSSCQAPCFDIQPAVCPAALGPAKTSKSWCSTPACRRFCPPGTPQTCRHLPVRGNGFCLCAELGWGKGCSCYADPGSSAFSICSKKLL